MRNQHLFCRLIYYNKLMKMIRITKNVFKKCSINIGRNFTKSPKVQTDILKKLEKKFQVDVENKLVIPIFKKALLFDEQLAMIDSTGEYSYLQLYLSAKKLSYQVSNICGSAASTNVGYICTKDALSTVAQWACWMSGQVAMPIQGDYPFELIKYLLKNAETQLLISTMEYEEVAEKLATKLNLALLVLDLSFITSQNDISAMKKKMVLAVNNSVMIEGTLNNDFYTESNALLLHSFPAGDNPKGVLLSYKNIDVQIKSLVQAWGICDSDNFLHVLPLNHIHGCVVNLSVPLSVGAKVTMHKEFNTENVWRTLLGINMPTKERVNILLSVPKIYSLLIADYDKIFIKNSQMVEYIKNYCEKHIRIMGSGYCALDETISNRWYKITGHRLLNYYGMIETGIVLSNPFHKNTVNNSDKLLCGCLPLRNVHARIVDSNQKVILEKIGNGGYAINDDQHLSTSDSVLNESCNETMNSECNIIGELLVSAPSIFKGYFKSANDDSNMFINGFYKTGDIVKFEGGYFKIVGKNEIDVIDIKGLCVSSLQVESIIMNHHSVKDAAVIAIRNNSGQQQICAACVLNPDSTVDLASLQEFCSKYLVTNEIPTLLKVVNEIPRNAMFKIKKEDLKQLLLMNLNTEQTN